MPSTQKRPPVGGFIPAVVALLKSLPVLHVDETSDPVDTTTCWIHVVSNRLYTLIHASVTRGEQAIRTAGVLIGYRGIVVDDRLAMYWKIKVQTRRMRSEPAARPG
jgi:hypothetical protein